MDSGEDPSAQSASSESLVAGAVLIGIGGMLCLTGLTISGAALASTAIRWINEVDVMHRINEVDVMRRINEMDVARAEFARQQWARARAVTAAGAQRWRGSAAASVDGSSAEDGAPAEGSASAEDGAS